MLDRAERPWYAGGVAAENRALRRLPDRGPMDPYDGQGIVDLRAPGGDPASRRLGDGLAECLKRFLAATADERTLERAREAVARWYVTRPT